MRRLLDSIVQKPDAETESTEPLNRSSIEAYVGIAIGVVLAVFRMTWWIRIPLFAVLCFVCMDFCWRLPLALKYLKRVPRFLICIAIAMILVQVGWRNVSEAWKAENLPPEAVDYFKGWGPTDPNTTVNRTTVEVNGREVSSNKPVLHGEASNRIIVDSAKLKDFTDKYYLWSACFHWNGREDPQDVTNISHTGLFNITGTDVTMIIPWNSQYYEEVLDGKRNTQYYVLLLPHKAKKSDFASIREAIASGASILEDRSGPP